MGNNHIFREKYISEFKENVQKLLNKLHEGEIINTYNDEFFIRDLIPIVCSVRGCYTLSKSKREFLRDYYKVIRHCEWCGKESITELGY